MANSGIQKIKRIAVLGRGSHTIPSYRALLNSLSQSYQLVVYSEFPITQNFSANYKIRSMPYKRMHRWFVGSWFLINICIDHLIHPFHIIHSHSTYPSGRIAILLKRLLRIPVILGLDGEESIGIDSIRFGDLLNKPKARVNRQVIAHANVVTALTEFQASSVRKIFGPNHLRVIVRGIDTSLVRAARNFDLSKTGKIVFLNVGYLHPVKDPITLMNCFQLLTKSFDCQLIQVGHDYMDGEVQRHANVLGIGHLVDFRGFVEHEKIYAIFQEANILLHTSLFESQAFVVNEALAHGLLVCGTHVGLLADLSEQCCVTVGTGDFEALAQQVIELLNNPARCQQLRENGLQWSREHDLEWTTNRYKEIYAELLNSKDKN